MPTMGISSGNASLILILSITFVLVVHIAEAHVKRTCDPGSFDNSHQCAPCTDCLEMQRKPSGCFTVCPEYLTTQKTTSTSTKQTTSPTPELPLASTTTKQTTTQTPELPSSTNTITLTWLLKLSQTLTPAPDLHSGNDGAIIFSILLLALIGIIIVMFVGIYCQRSRNRHSATGNINRDVKKDNPEKLPWCVNCDPKTKKVYTSIVNINECEVNAIHKDEEEADTVSKDEEETVTVAKHEEEPATVPKHEEETATGPKDEEELDTVPKCPSTTPTYTSATTDADERCELAIGTTPYTARVHGKI